MFFSPQNRKISPALVPYLAVGDEGAAKYQAEAQKLLHNGGEARMMGLDTGNEAADFEAGVWLMALIATLAAAVPVAFLNPSLGFKKRSLEEEKSHLFENGAHFENGGLIKLWTDVKKLSNSVNSAITQAKQVYEGKDL
jgi:hypothetical protein